jgi:hypothetical protein
VGVRSQSTADQRHFSEITVPSLREFGQNRGEIQKAFIGVHFYVNKGNSGSQQLI